MGKASKNKNKIKKSLVDPTAIMQPRYLFPLITTTEGVDAYLEDRPNFLEEMIGSLQSLRTKFVATGEWLCLKHYYSFCGHVATKATPAAFAMIPEAHLDLWLAHASGVFNELSTNDQWMSTGRLLLHDLELMDAVGLFADHRASCVVRKSFLRFLQVLADFCAACEAPLIPCHKVANHIRSLSFNYVYHLIAAKKTPEEAFRTLAKHGILAQTLRCFIASEISQDHLSLLELIFTSWTKNQRIYRRGTPTGDMLSSLLEGPDSHVLSSWCENVEARKKLETLAKLRNYAEDDPKNSSLCFHCSRFTPMDMVCARCKRKFDFEMVFSCVQLETLSLTFKILKHIDARYRSTILFQSM